MPKYEINPLAMIGTPCEIVENKLLLIRLIRKQNAAFIPKGEYLIRHKNQENTLTLTHSLLIRPRKHQEGQIRIEIISSKSLNTGSFGQIYKSHGVLLPEKDCEYKKKSVEKSRICKVIHYTRPTSKQTINDEAKYTQMNQLLHCKAAVFDNRNGYIIMRRAQKMDLHTFICKIESKDIQVSIQQRLELTSQMIKAIKKQVHDLGITHNDIKPENMIVNWKQSKITVIDYGFGRPQMYSNDGLNLFGTPIFIAPEIFDIESNMRTIQSDIYALGLTIAEFWGDLSAEKFVANDDMYDVVKLVNQDRKLVGLFKGLALSEPFKQKIEEQLNLMIQSNPKNRISLNQALANWSGIQTAYREENLIQQLSNTLNITNLQQPNPARSTSNSRSLEDYKEKLIVSKNPSDASLAEEHQHPEKLVVTQNRFFKKTKKSEKTNNLHPTTKYKLL